MARGSRPSASIPGSTPRPRIRSSASPTAGASWPRSSPAASSTGRRACPGATGWSAPVAIAAAASDPALDTSINGVSYVTYTSAGDVLAARLARDATGVGAARGAAGHHARGHLGRSRTSRVSADGVAMSTFVEGRQVIARKLFGTKVSQVPAGPQRRPGRGATGGSADSPDVDVEDDSSFAWVVFRQNFDDHPRVLARRLLGSTFDPPVVDRRRASRARPPRIDLSERGEGHDRRRHARQRRRRRHAAPRQLRARRRGSTPPATSVDARAGRRRSARTAPRRSAGCRRPTPADAPAVHARHWIIDQTPPRLSRSPEPDTLISNPAFGPVDSRRRPRCGRRPARRLRDGLRPGRRRRPQARRRPSSTARPASSSRTSAAATGRCGSGC